MFAFLKKLFGASDSTSAKHPLDGATRTAQEKAQAPYKLETPQPAKCGCGRSPTGFCVGLHKLSEQEWATHADNPNKAVAAKSAKSKPQAKKPAAKKAAAKPAAKPAAIKAAKKPKKAS